MWSGRILLVFVSCHLALWQTVLGVKCHSCSGEVDCVNVIAKYPERSGRCQTATTDGKCFIRRDSNNIIYWGCMDDTFWPGVPWRTYHGCREDWERGWEYDGHRQPIVWCICDEDDCNESIEKANSTSRTTAAWGATTTPQRILDIVPDDCPKPFQRVPGLTSCYHVVTPQLDGANQSQGRDFRTAASECRGLDPRAHLVALDSEREKSRLAALLQSEPRMLQGWQGWWTSGSYSITDGWFVWLNGFTSDNNNNSTRSNNSSIHNDDNNIHKINNTNNGNNNNLSDLLKDTILARTGPLWGFQKTPYEDTCVWILQIEYYNYTLGNYDCATKTGYVCEIELIAASGRQDVTQRTNETH